MFYPTSQQIAAFGRFFQQSGSTTAVKPDTKGAPRRADFLTPGQGAARSLSRRSVTSSCGPLFDCLHSCRTLRRGDLPTSVDALLANPRSRSYAAFKTWCTTAHAPEGLKFIEALNAMPALPTQGSRPQGKQRWINAAHQIRPAALDLNITGDLCRDLRAAFAAVLDTAPITGKPASTEACAALSEVLTRARAAAVNGPLLGTFRDFRANTPL